MKSFFAALVAASFAVSAQDDPFLKDGELKTAVEARCADGCVIFSREDAERFQEALDELMAKKQKEAYQAGVKYQAQACRSLL